MNAQTPEEFLPCPECSEGKVFAHTDGLVGRMFAPPFFNPKKDKLTWRMVRARFGACNACEFCIEIQ